MTQAVSKVALTMPGLAVLVWGMSTLVSRSTGVSPARMLPIWRIAGSTNKNAITAAAVMNRPRMPRSMRLETGVMVDISGPSLRAYR